MPHFSYMEGIKYVKYIMKMTKILPSVQPKCGILIPYYLVKLENMPNQLSGEDN